MRDLRITVDDYRAGRHRELADQLMEALHLDPRTVTEIVVSPYRVVMFVVDHRAGQELTVRQVIYDLPRGVVVPDDDRG